MKKIKLPSLQHVARQWAPTPEKVAKNLERLALASPPFSYEPLYHLVRGMLVLDDPLAQVCHAVQARKLHPHAKRNYLELLPMVSEHFSAVRPEYILEVAPRFYPVGKDLFVPFKPPLLYGKGGDEFLPWFVFWKVNPVAGENLSLFVTLVVEMMAQDPDLERAKFTIVDFSADDAKSPRKIELIDARAIARVPEARKIEMLDILVKGHHMAQANLRNRELPNESTKLPPDDRQPDLPF